MIRRNTARIVAALFLATVICASASAAKIAVIGTGQVGAALGQRFAQLGHAVTYGSRDPQRADVAGLVARTGRGATAATHAFDGSNAERIQAVAPRAKVVKAFSTLGADTMLDPDLAQGPVTIPIVGDDAGAKAVVAELVEGMGMIALDVGPLRYAKIIEGLHFLRYNAGRLGGARFNYYLRPEAAE